MAAAHWMEDSWPDAEARGDLESPGNRNSPGLSEQRLTSGLGGESDCRRSQALGCTPGVNDLHSRRCKADNPPGHRRAEVMGRSTGESGARRAGWCPCRCWETWMLRGLILRSPVLFWAWSGAAADNGLECTLAAITLDHRPCRVHHAHR